MKIKNIFKKKETPPEQVKPQAIELSDLEVRLTVEILFDYFKRISHLKNNDVEILREHVKTICNKLQKIKIPGEN